MAETSAVVVIGGTSGIGRAIALRFAEEGWQVVVAGRDQARGAAAATECETAGAPAVRFVETDVAVPASVQRLAQTAQAAFGPPHAVINCAGILQSGQRVLDQDLDEDERIWRVNYRGTLLGCQTFGAHDGLRGDGLAPGWCWRCRPRRGLRSRLSLVWLIRRGVCRAVTKQATGAPANC